MIKELQISSCLRHSKNDLNLVKEINAKNLNIGSNSGCIGDYLKGIMQRVFKETDFIPLLKNMEYRDSLYTKIYY
jgi:hypothetical protein